MTSQRRKGEGVDQFGTPPFFLKYGGENNMLLNIMPKEWSGEQALHSAAQATRDGNILDLKGMCGTLVLQVTGTFSGTIVPKVSNDNVNYAERLAIDGKTGASSYSITTPGIYTIDVVGIKKFKAEITAFTAGSGSITVTALGLPITSGMGSGAANLINNIINGTAPATVTISDSNVEAINGEDAATKSDLVAGKTVGGKQVPLNVDADGKLQVGGITVESLTATTVGIDQETENANEVVVKSGSITLTGSTIPKTQPIPIVKAPVRVISMIINAVSKAAGTNTGAVSLGLDGTEDEVWLAINIDKQPWTLSSTNVFGNDLAACNYPIYASHATAYASGGLPAISLVLGIAPSNQLGAPVTTFAEARNVRQPYTSAITCAIANGHATDTATITVKVIRVWR